LLASFVWQIAGLFCLAEFLLSFCNLPSIECLGEVGPQTLHTLRFDIFQEIRKSASERPERTQQAIAQARDGPGLSVQHVDLFYHLKSSKITTPTSDRFDHWTSLTFLERFLILHNPRII